jgi:ABC-2 type transport system permease protein
VAAVVLFGFLVHSFTLARRMRAASGLDPAKQLEAVAMPYHIAAGLIMVTAFLVGFFYCLDALHGERRDRSILFWKSLPVSDRTTVLAKAAIPLVVLPVLAASIVAATQLGILLVSTLALLADPSSLAALWGRLPLLGLWLAAAYALVAGALWHLPLYAWLLLVSGWARRATFLWAVLPPLAVCVFEGIAFRTSHFAQFLKYRLIGWFTQAFVHPGSGAGPDNPLAHLTPGRFLATPGLWIGLAFAALFLAAAAHLRRHREPI